jgi:ligand-binding SRPBCC domain-containing protein
LKVHLLEREQLVPVPPAEAFGLFADARNLEPMTPPWLRFRIVTPPPITMGSGTRIDYALRLHGIPIRWSAEIIAWEIGVRFEDVQRRGPYALWHHTHVFEQAEGGTMMRDQVRYALPLGLLGELAHVAVVRRDLERIFDYRREAVVRLATAGGSKTPASPDTGY